LSELVIKCRGEEGNFYSEEQIESIMKTLFFSACCQMDVIRIETHKDRIPEEWVRVAIRFVDDTFYYGEKAIEYDLLGGNAICVSLLTHYNTDIPPENAPQQAAREFAGSFFKLSRMFQNWVFYCAEDINVFSLWISPEAFSAIS